MLVNTSILSFHPFFMSRIFISKWTKSYVVKVLIHQLYDMKMVEDIHGIWTDLGLCVVCMRINAHFPPFWSNTIVPCRLAVRSLSSRTKEETDIVCAWSNAQNKKRIVADSIHFIISVYLWLFHKSNHVFSDDQQSIPKNMREKENTHEIKVKRLTSQPTFTLYKNIMTLSY